ncbi:MAG: hypothetical protein OXT65_10810, partial [Alphaproteobacteria bacterium]|nr:hypothetical protein [Alphaproteobacteria bacterium]
MSRNAMREAENLFDNLIERRDFGCWRLAFFIFALCIQFFERDRLNTGLGDALDKLATDGQHIEER